MNLGLPEILLIALVILLLFGGKKIPELMNGLGKGVKSFRDGVNGKGDDSTANDPAAAQQNATQASQQPPQDKATAEKTNS